jgi:hypothetical protein
MTTALNILHNEKDTIFRIWLYILKNSPTKTWEQPILAFIDSIKEKLPNEKVGLSSENIEQCNNSMRNLARYIYAKSLANEPKDGQTIKQEMLNATALAKQGKIYEPKIKITKNFRLSKQFEQKLNGNIPKQLQWGLCAVVEFSRNFGEFVERESKLKLKNSILETSVVEQIFPDNWEPDTSDPWHEVVHNNEQDGWDNRKIRKSLKTIGNLVLIEQNIHTNTNKIYKGNFFAKRKTPEIGRNYKNSIFSEILLFCNSFDISHEIPWSYSQYAYRQKYSVERLIDFFSGLNECVLH